MIVEKNHRKGPGETQGGQHCQALLRQTWPQETEENEAKLHDLRQKLRQKYGKQTPRGATRNSLQESFLAPETRILGRGLFRMQ